MTENTEVVVIGGGYAGVMAANRLTQRDDVTVTLINPRSAFVPRLRLHQLVGGSHDAVVDYREILAEGVRLAVDTVTRIDTAVRSVALRSGGTAGYDYLIYAAGSGSTDLRVPGAAEFAHPVATLEAAQRLRSSSTPRTRRPPLTVVAPVRRASRPPPAPGAGPPGDPGLRRRARPVPAPSGPTHGCQAARPARGDRARRSRHEGHGGDAPRRAPR